MLIVNKDRLFLENVGAVKELSKVKVKTRLTYNCAHLRSTKETLTIEYFRIILEKKIG